MSFIRQNCLRLETIEESVFVSGEEKKIIASSHLGD